MSIASEITRLTNAKNDIKTSIENKGVEVPSSAKLDEYYNYIDEIEDGLEIQNGRLEHYKSLESIVKAGTFIKLITTYNNILIYNLMNQVPTYISNNSGAWGLFHLVDDIYCFLSRNSTNAYINTIQLTSGGVIKYLNPFVLPTPATEIGILQLDSSHLLYMNYGSRVDYYIITYENGSWTSSASIYNMNTYFLPSNSIVKTNSYNWYVQGLNNPTSYGNSNVNPMCMQISKSTNAVSIYSYGGAGSVIPYNNRVCTMEPFYINRAIVGGQNGIATLYYPTSTDPSITNKYLNFNGLTDFFVFNLGGRYFILGRQTSGDSITRVLQEISVSNSGVITSVGNPINLGDEFVWCSSASGVANTSRYLTINKLDTNTILFVYPSYSNNSKICCRVFKLEDGNVRVSNEVQIDTLLTTTPTYINNTFHNAIKTNDEKIIMVCYKSIGVYYLDENLNLTQIGENPISVAPATSVIEGITTTDCTSLEAGDVYLLDNTI